MTKLYSKSRDPKRACPLVSLEKLQRIKKVMILMLLLTFSAGGQTFAQQQISGVVKELDGQPLPGVNIVVKGKNLGTTSDSEGRYSLQVPDDASILVFSFIGYATQERAITGVTQLNVDLQSDVKSLEEVVVVGFGTKKKEAITGAIAQVKGEDVFSNKGINNVGLALQGEVPGLIVTRTSSRPGNEGMNIKIRGDISVNSNTGPMILIDGIDAPQWELAQLNPQDIESVTVLKDASAAIYGARAAGGVILVTTKRGQQGKSKITYNGSYSRTIDGIRTPTATMSEYGTMFKQGVENDAAFLGVAKNWWIFDEERVNGFITGKPFSYTTTDSKTHYYDDVNLLEELYGQSTSQNHNLSISGGAEKVNYRASVGYGDNRAQLKTAYDGEKKWSTRLNLDYRASDLFKFELGTSYDKRTVRSPTNGVGRGYEDMYIFPIINPQGDYYDTFGGRNPIAETRLGGDTESVEEIFRLNGKVILDLSRWVDGLSVTGSTAFRSRKGWKTAVQKQYSLYDWTSTNVTYTKYSPGRIEETIGQTTYQNHGLFVDYNKSIASVHNITATFGINGELSQDQTVVAGRKDALDSDLTDINAFKNVDPWNSGGSNAWGIVSYIGRVNYDYKRRYLLEFLGRRDGSSRLHPDYRWKNFYGVFAGWRLAEEEFVKNLGIFNELKLRASYGKTGGLSGIGFYDYISAITLGQTIMGTNSDYQQTATVASLTSTDRSWEIIENQNFGIDVAVLENRLGLTADYFIRENKDMLIPVTLPSVIGVDAPRTNSGNFLTKGWEVALKWNDQIGSVRYGAQLSLSNDKGKVVSMEGSTLKNPGKNSIVEGYPLNAIFVYKTNGYFKNQEDVDAYTALYANTGVLPTGDARLRPGAVERVDTNGDGKINTSDIYYYGDAQPHYLFGLRLFAEWKGFDISAFVQGVGKQYILRSGHMRAPFVTIWTNQNRNFTGNTWTPENTDAEFPIMSRLASLNSWDYDNNDYRVEKLRYARLKNFVVGYTIPSSYTKRIGMEKARFYFSGFDLFEFCNVKDGFDPEYSESANNTYPFSRLLTFGVDITF